jgi:hypothetical protein
MFRLINCGIPQKFSKLRFGFIETAATWVPWVVYELRRRLDKVGNRLPDDLLERCGIFVTCQIGDDVPYLIQSCMGENTLMIGTDFGHADSSTELDALTTLKNSGGISAAQHKKIVEDNPRAFYGLA